MKAIAATLLLLTGFFPDRAAWQREYERRLLLCSGRMMSKKHCRGRASDCGEVHVEGPARH